MPSEIEPALKTEPSQRGTSIPHCSATTTNNVSLIPFTGNFLWLGTVGFGGPIALPGHMQQDLVDRYGWISREDHLEGLARRSIYDLPTAIIGVAILDILFRWKVPEPLIIATAALAGLILHGRLCHGNPMRPAA